MHTRTARAVLGVEEVGLRGLHNRRNAMAAAAICLARGIEPDAVCSALRTFAGVGAMALAERQE